MLLHKKNKELERGTLETMLNCKKCEYKCKKESTLKKHFHTKHEDQKCQRCEKYINHQLSWSFMLLRITSVTFRRTSYIQDSR